MGRLEENRRTRRSLYTVTALPLPSLAHVSSTMRAFASGVLMSVPLSSCPSLYLPGLPLYGPETKSLVTQLCVSNIGMLAQGIGLFDFAVR